MPASRRAQILAARPASAECAQELSAKGHWFAKRTASLSLFPFTRKMDRIGPNVSSLAISMSSVTSASTVGSKNCPDGNSWFRLPPASTLAPLATASSSSRWYPSRLGGWTQAPQSTKSLLKGGPWRIVFTTAVTSSQKVSYTLSYTMKRSGPAQFCPMFWYAPRTTNWASSFGFMSSHTMNGSLPPSSRMTGVSVWAAASMTFRPTPTLPTKITLSAPATSADPVSA
mmetsp:Transcript_43615/g.120687  ORF Transcript_43615/g.120687 Transcript_43615/m.120687 type:complete len:228 (-) Transcript_43615:893-1576(-)